MLVGHDKTASTILNTICQGNAAVGLKLGLIAAGKAGYFSKYLGLVVHDEVVACVPKEEAHDYAVQLGERLCFGMQQITEVPIRTEFKIGEYWS
jgi:DNA polymerase I-like protein with 3'-5' exonuclease and polymerase domains